MRKITSGLFISLDGVVEDPQDWHFPYFNDEMGAAVDRQLATADTLLLGRKTNDSFAGAWPEREVAGAEDANMGKALGDARKIVASNQDLQFTWRNSEQLKGNLVEAVTALKNEPDATDIAMSGSVSVVCQLVAAGLPRRTAPASPPDRRTEGHAPVRGGRSPDPVAADLLPGLQHRRCVPHLRPSRIDSRGHVRRCESASAPGWRERRSAASPRNRIVGWPC
jgi:dihydrofolate reductase